MPPSILLKPILTKMKSLKHVRFALKFIKLEEAQWVDITTQPIQKLKNTTIPAKYVLNIHLQHLLSKLLNILERIIQKGQIYFPTNVSIVTKVFISMKKSLLMKKMIMEYPILLINVLIVL